MKIACIVAGVVPHGVEPAIRRHGKRAKPMPFVCGGIVVDSHRCAKASAAIRAAREHDVCAIAIVWRPNTAQHVNVVVRGAARTVHCHEYLCCEPSRIYIPARTHATQIDLSDLFEDWRLSTYLRVTGANAPELGADQILSADEQIAVCIHISGSMDDPMRNIDWALPGHAAICGTAEFAGRARKVGCPKLVVKPVTWPGGPINRKPLFVASARPRKTCP